jgi:5-methylcytosine-specific restriction endonuclease McrA
MLKVCTRCRTPKSLDEFPKDKSKKDGRYPVCKVCRSPIANASYAARQPQERERRKARYHANPDKFRAESKRFREEHPEYMRDYLRTYYEANKAELKADRRARYWSNVDAERRYRRQYNAANREKVREGVRDWFRRHPHVSTLASANYRARLKQVDNTLTAEQLDEILEFFDFRCGYCLVDLRTLPKGQATWDHMQPLIRGGTNTADNVIPCCKACNSRKKDRSMLLMARYASAA